MKKIISIFAVAAAIFALSSCNSEVDLSGKWTIDTVKGEELPELFEGQETPYIEFDTEKSRMHGCAGINLINSAYTYSGDSLKFTLPVSTLMAGPVRWMEAERSILKSLVATRTVKGNSSCLRLYDEEGEEVLTLKK